MPSLKRRAFLGWTIGFAGSTLARAAMAAAGSVGDVEPIVLATSTPGGGFALYGETLERVLRDEDGRPLVRARPTRGTAENLVLLRRGEIDAALIQGTAAGEILQGGATDLKVLFAMYPSPGMLAVPAASPIERLEDVRGRPVVSGVRASGLVTLARQVFDGVGLDIDIDRDVRSIYVEQAAESPRLVTSGHAVGLWGAGEGWPGFVQLAAAPGGARFIGPSGAAIGRIVARYPRLKPMDVPAGAYAGIDRPLPTVGSMNLILVRADLADSRVEAFVDAMRRSHVSLTTALPQAASSTLAETLDSVPSPDALHRAVRRVPLRPQ